MRSEFQYVKVEEVNDSPLTKKIQLDQWVSPLVDCPKNRQRLEIERGVGAAHRMDKKK